MCIRDSYSSRSTARCLSSLRAFYNYICAELNLVDNPTAKIDSPKQGHTLPKVLSEDDVEALILAPNVDDPIGLRDRAMLEVLYACGLRVSELINLDLLSVNIRQGVVRVMGKGKKERLVPLGEEALSWINKYLEEARTSLSVDNINDSALFLCNSGMGLSRLSFW